MEKVDLKNKRSRTFRRVASGKKPLRKRMDTIETKKHVSESKPTAYIGGVSVIISAWNTAEYIEECLDSVSNQTWFKNHENWEILLGIDACEKTLSKVKEIMKKYKNMKVVMMNENVGTYVTCNTLSSMAKYEWLLRFDSDDVMPNDMIEKIMKSNIHDFQIIRYKFRNFGESKSMPSFAYGSHMVKKSFFQQHGGYRDWKIAADYDFCYRLDNGNNILKLENVCYNRRVRGNSLQYSEETNMQSEKRKTLHIFIENESRKNMSIKLTTGKYFSIFDSTPSICFIIPNRGGENLDYVIKNLKKNYKIYNIDIIVIEQNDDNIFKKGQLYNIALLLTNTMFVAMCDNDIIHFKPIELLSEYYKTNKPFLGFRDISQITLVDGKEIITSTTMNPNGAGGFLFAKKEDFMRINGYSNLFLGWGCEDNEVSCRLCGDNNRKPSVRHLNNTLGHITHKKRNFEKIYNRNKKIFYSRKNRDILKDGLKQTTFELISKETRENVTYIYVKNIGVCEDFAYKNILNL